LGDLVEVVDAEGVRGCFCVAVVVDLHLGAINIFTAKLGISEV